MQNHQAIGPTFRAYFQAMIGEGREQGLRGSLDCFLPGKLAPLPFLEVQRMSLHPRHDAPSSTLVIVENLIFGTRGSFRSELSPQRLAELALMFLEIDYFPDAATNPPQWGSGQYCDYGSAAVAVILGPNRVTLRYHAAGDVAEAKAWFLANDHVRADGRLGRHRRTAKGRAVS